MRIVLLGGSGQVGRAFLEAAPDGYEVLAPVSSELDLADPRAPAAALARLRPALVVNAAAYTQVDRAEDEPARAEAINARGPAALAQAAADRGIPLFHLSTDYVFGGEAGLEGRRGYRETDEPAPLGVYGRTKLAGERAVREALAQHLVVRTSWVFGAHGHNFVRTLLRLAGEREVLRVVADQRGGPTHAGALASMLWRLAVRYRREGALPWGLYHYAGSPVCSWHGFAEAIVDGGMAHGLLARRPRIEAIGTAEYPTRARRPAWSALDCTRFGEAFGSAPEPWAPGLEATLRALAAR